MAGTSLECDLVETLDPSCPGKVCASIDVETDDAPTEIPDGIHARNRRARRKTGEEMRMANEAKILGDMEAAIDKRLEPFRLDMIDLINAKLQAKPAWLDELMDQLIKTNRQQFGDALQGFHQDCSEMTKNFSARHEQVVRATRRLRKDVRNLNGMAHTAAKRFKDIDVTLRDARETFDKCMAGIREELNEHEGRFESVEYRLMLDAEAPACNSQSKLDPWMDGWSGEYESEGEGPEIQKLPWMERMRVLGQSTDAKSPNHRPSENLESTTRSSPHDFNVGDEVEVHSLQTRWMNGYRGRILHQRGDRFAVAFPVPVGEKAIKPTNLRRVEHKIGGGARSSFESEK